jgi:hypothetical protein
MKKTKSFFNSFFPFSLSNPYFAQTIAIAIVITIHRNDRQRRMQPALSPPLSPVNYHCHPDDQNYYQHTPCCRLQCTVVTAATTTLLPHFQTRCCYG